MAANLQPISSDGGFNSGGNININNGGNIVTAPEQDLNIIVQDSNDDGLVLRQVVTDGTDPQTSTEMDVDAFSIYTDVTGDNNRWEFSGTTLQTPGNGARLRGFNSNIAVQSMVSGGSPVASLQVVNGVNDPNIFATFDATSTGANIKVYNGGSNGGVEHAWQFDNDGVLTVAGNIIMADGATLKGTGASPAPKISGFDSASFGGNLSAANLTVANLTANATALFGPSASANFTRFPHAQVVISNVAAGIQQNESGNIGLISETTANSANTSVRGVGVYGVGYTAGGASADGIDGEGHVSDTNDTGTATGVRGYSYDTHAGGVNIGVYASALNGATNYALYMKHGNIISDDPQTWTLADNNASALSFNATGKTGILNIVTTNSSEGVTMSGSLSVTGNATVGNISATNIGNIANINLTGNGSQVFLGNGAFASIPSSSIIANGNSNVTIATSAGNVVTNVNGALALTVSASGIKVSGGGALQSPGGATAITLNNNGANIPTANITTQLNVTGASGANITANLTAGNISTGGALSVIGNAAVTGTLTSTGKIGYASGSTVTQTTNRGNGVTINALAGTIITTSATMVAGQIDTFSVANDQVDPNNDIVLVQIVSPNFGVYNCIAQPSATISTFLNGFYINIQNISGFTTSSDAITIRFMVIKAPNA